MLSQFVFGFVFSLFYCTVLFSNDGESVLHLWWKLKFIRMLMNVLGVHS